MWNRFFYNHTILLNVTKFSNGMNLKCYLHVGYKFLINNLTWSTFEGLLAFSSFSINSKSLCVIVRSTLDEYWRKNFLQRSSQCVTFRASTMFYHLITSSSNVQGNMMWKISFSISFEVMKLTKFLTIVVRLFSSIKFDIWCTCLLYTSPSPRD